MDGNACCKWQSVEVMYMGSYRRSMTYTNPKFYSSIHCVIVTRPTKIDHVSENYTELYFC